MTVRVGVRVRVRVRVGVTRCEEAGEDHRLEDLVVRTPRDAELHAQVEEGDAVVARPCLRRVVELGEGEHERRGAGEVGGRQVEEAWQAAVRARGSAGLQLPAGRRAGWPL